MKILNLFLEDLNKIQILISENLLFQMEFLSSCIIVIATLWIVYKGLKYRKIRDIFTIHNPTSNNFYRNCLDAPLLSGNGIAMWRIYCSLPLAILTIIFYKNIVISSTLLQFYVFLFASDALDGAVARKLDNVTDFGKVLDPLADKILDLIVLFIVCYFSENIFFMILTFGIIIFDIFGQKLRTKTSNPAANWVGKTKTVLKIIAIYIISLNRFDVFLDAIGGFFLILSFIFTFWSFWLKFKNKFS